MIAYWDTEQEANEVIEEMGLFEAVAVKSTETGLWFIKRHNKLSGVPVYINDLP